MAPDRPLGASSGLRSPNANDWEPSMCGHPVLGMQDPRFMAAIGMESPKAIVLDIRFPTLPIAELNRHQAPANAITWAPHSSCHLCTAGDDCQGDFRGHRCLPPFALDLKRRCVAAACASSRSPQPEAPTCTQGMMFPCVVQASHSLCPDPPAHPSRAALIWDLGPGVAKREQGLDPILAYTAEKPINQLQWSSLQTEWLAICYDQKTQILRV